MMKTILRVVAALILISLSALAQQPQTSTAPIIAANSKYVQGVGPGYWPTKGSGLTLNLTAGTAYCGAPPVAINYAGGTLAMTDATTNYVYLNTAASCVPATKTSVFAAADVPIAKVVTAGGVITTITDLRMALAEDQGGVAAPAHDILSGTHSDALAGAVTLGDMMYGNATPKWARLAGNTTAVKLFLTQTGTGAVSAVPAWAAIIDGDVPNNITIDLATLATTATTANAGDSATAFFSSGALELAIGGTNQTSWTASRCVQVNAGGTALESAAAACGAGGSSAWEALVNTADTATSYLSNNTAEVVTFSFESAFAASQQFLIRQQTGNPTAGTLLDVRAADPQVTAFRAGDGTNGITVSQAGALTAEGTGTIVSTDVSCTGCLDATNLDTDSVSADELNATGVEAELEGVLDIPELQGQVGDAQIADAAVDGGTGGEIADNTITAADVDETGAYAFSSVTNAFTGATYTGPTADPADSGLLRASNAEKAVCWEASAPGTDVCLEADATEIIQVTGGTFDAADLSGTVPDASVDGANEAGEIDIDNLAGLTAIGSALTITNTANTFTGAVYTSGAADPADAGVLRLGNNEAINFELATPGTDKYLKVNTSDQLETNADIKGTNALGYGSVTVGEAGTATAASFLAAIGGNAASNAEAAYVRLVPSPEASGDDSYIYPGGVGACIGVSSTAPSADTTNCILDMTTARTLSAKTIAGLASGTTHGTANFVSVNRHATDCTAITDGVDGEQCWEKDADTIYVCEPTAGGCDTAGEWIRVTAAGASGANQQLSNLAATVAVNLALIPGAAGTLDLGSATLPWKEILLAGTSGTPGTNNFKITGASTAGTRTVTLANGDSATVIADAGAANNFLTAIAATGVISKAQPAFSNLSGSATDGQLSANVALYNNGTKTWGAAAPLNWTFDAGVTDPVFEFTSANLKFSGATTYTWEGGATDPVFTPGNSIMNLSTGTLQQGGTAVGLTTAIGTTGTAPNWATQVLNIPLAVTASVTAGLISKTEFDTFNGKPALVAAGTNAIAAFNAGDDATAARSDHTHRSLHQLSWYFPGTPASGIAVMTLTLPDGITNPLITDMRVTVNTTSASSSAFNIQRCTATCTGAAAFADIYAANLTLSANVRTVAKGSAPDQNVSGLAAGDQFKADLTTIGASLADVTVTMTVKYENTN